MQDRRLRSEKTEDTQRFEWKSNRTEMAKYTMTGFKIER